MNNTLQWNVSERASAFHADALVCDLTLPWLPGLENKETTLPRYPASGVDFVSLSIGHDEYGLATTIHHMADVKGRLGAEPDKYVLVESADDILQAKAAGKLAVGLHFQGSEMLEGDASLVQLFYQLGIRHMLLAYNQKNRAADGCHERTDCGLSRYGVRLIEEMNRVGMILDLTHVGYRSSMEAMEVSADPVIFSHSNAYAVKEHPRNLRDEQIKACARKGGLIGINGVGHFLGDNKASTENFIRHIDYMAQLVGPQHVGIGTDYVYFLEQMHRKFLANPERYPEGYPRTIGEREYFPPERLPQVTEALLKRNYPEDEIRGVLGENFLRVARRVWK